MKSIKYGTGHLKLTENLRFQTVAANEKFLVIYLYSYCSFTEGIKTDWMYVLIRRMINNNAILL